MGAAQSSSPTEKVVYNETPIQFSPDLVNHLADSSSSPDTTPAQQSVLDAHVRARIQSEIARLRAEEDEVRQEIEAALEKENIERERRGGEKEGEGEEDETQVGTSASLKADLDEVQKKVERFQNRRGLEDVPGVKDAKDAVVECYRRNPTTSLDCWKEVALFKGEVVKAEQKFLETLR